MTLREIFETVKKHLLAQGKRAVSDDYTCMYRGNNGLKCAVGCLIPDEVYTDKGEYAAMMSVGPCGDRWIAHSDIPGSTFLATMLNDAGIPANAPTEDLLVALQGAHDCRGNWEGDMEGLRGELKRIERRFFDTVTVED